MRRDCQSHSIDVDVFVNLECHNDIISGRCGSLEAWFSLLQQVVSSGRVQDPIMEVCWQILLEG